MDNIWDNPYYALGIGCSKCSYGYDYHGYNFTGVGGPEGKPCGGTPTDLSGHGTHVAGIVGAKGNNNIGISGVNWNVKLAWLGVSIGSRYLSTDAAIEALNYANNHNILITNNSYGGSGYSSIFKKAISDYKGLFVAAAGNDSANNNAGNHYPSNYDCPNIISVASTDENNDLSDFSNYGSTTVHVAAPGSDIYSTIPNGGYDYMSGTSMASPCVAGIAALIKAKNPSFNAKQIKAAICGTVQSQGKTYNVIHDGGIVNAYAAVGTTESSLKSITFNYNYSGASQTFIDYVVSGKKVNEPSLYPTRTGYIFKGWYTTQTGSTLFNFNNPITSNKTIYAQWTPVVANTYGEKFPDYKFRGEVINILNSKDGGTRTVNSIVSESDISLMASIKSLNISSKGIRDITGLSYFTGLTSLDCSINEIKFLDLSKIVLLKDVDCSNNLLSSLYLSNLKSLENLNCNNNLISSLSLSSLTSLKNLYCYNNLLTSLNANLSTQLQSINCSYNKIKTIYISSLSNLKVFDCSNNQLTSLSVGGFSLLQYLDCSYNKLTSLVTGSGLTKLYCNNNKLTILNVSGSKNLNRLYCNSNSLNVINVLSLSKLQDIDVSNNEMNRRNDVIGFNFWDVSDIFTTIFSPQNQWTSNPYSDVSDDDYYYKAVQYVCDKGFMNGTSQTRFEPTYTLSRGQLATIVYRMAGSPSVSGLSNPFTDVSSSSSYLDAIKWSYNNGNQTIMGGTSSTIFEPNVTVTREMVAVVLDRYATRKNISLEKIMSYTPFADDNEVSSWAKASITKLYEAGIINGNNNYFFPSEKIKRGDAATMIRKFDVIRFYL